MLLKSRDAWLIKSFCFSVAVRNMNENKRFCDPQRRVAFDFLFNWNGLSFSLFLLQCMALAYGRWKLAECQVWECKLSDGSNWLCREPWPFFYFFFFNFDLMLFLSALLVYLFCYWFYCVNNRITLIILLIFEFLVQKITNECRVFNIWPVQ